MIAEFLYKIKTHKCTKSNVKNPCKICLEQVTNRNGLQCQGACKKWAHYKCLHYTPGTISDITAGTLKVVCPCPDCEMTDSPTHTTHSPPRNSYADHPSEHALECPTQTKQPRDSPIPNIYKKRKEEKKAEKADPTNDSKNNSCDDLVCENQNITEDEDVDQMKNALHEMCGTVTQLSKQIKDLMCKIKMKE